MIWFNAAAADTPEILAGNSGLSIVTEADEDSSRLDPGTNPEKCANSRYAVTGKVRYPVYRLPDFQELAQFCDINRVVRVAFIYWNSSKKIP